MSYFVFRQRVRKHVKKHNSMQLQLPCFLVLLNLVEAIFCFTVLRQLCGKSIQTQSDLLLGNRASAGSRLWSKADVWKSGWPWDLVTTLFPNRAKPKSRSVSKLLDDWTFHPKLSVIQLRLSLRTHCKMWMPIAACCLEQKYVAVRLLWFSICNLTALTNGPRAPVCPVHTHTHTTKELYDFNDKWKQLQEECVK